jgi:hypothetical protein
MISMNGLAETNPTIGGNVTEEIKITPETYEKMNEEFEEDGTAFRIEVPTQEEIDKWQSQPAPTYKTPPAIDMVQQMWDEIGGRK